jgi:hypothetical protein
MPTQHTVEQGDCISSIAARYGFAWKTVWDDPLNSKLKQLRKDPAVLFPGDIVSIPDKDFATEQCATNARHKFVKQAEPTHIKIRFMLDGKPRAGIKYELQVAAWKFTGSTDADGFVKADIPPDASKGTLVLIDGTDRSVFELDFGTLDPIDTDDGVRERLSLLGFDVGANLADAVRDFQTMEKLSETGVIDDQFKAKLREKFGQ